MNQPAAAGISFGSRIVPALKVLIPLSGTDNRGPLTMSFARLFGFDSMSMSVSATAIKSPAIAPKGTVIPIAINSCLSELIWDNSSLKPRTTSSVKIYSALVMDAPNVTNDAIKCISGQWTTLDMVNNSATAVQQLMATGNSRPIYAGDDVYIQPGVKNSVYDDIILATSNGNTVAGYLPVTNGDLTQKGFLDAVGFIPFAITSAAKKGGLIPYSYVSGRPLSTAEAETLIPEANPRDVMTQAPRLVR